MLCQSCEKPKHQLFSKNSNIISDISLVLCQSCIDSKYEPRWVIILAGRSMGPEFVRDYIIKRRYLGKEISATELIA